MNTSELGRAGEQAAAELLEQAGWEVLGRSVRLPQGELDLVAREDKTLVFVEVKTRRGWAQGRPEEAVHPAKQHRLARLALAWLARHPRWRESPVRFDVIAVYGRPGQWQIRHLRDAFRPGL